jgi:hypothetical protein
MAYSAEEKAYVLELYELSGKSKSLATRLFFEKYQVKISDRTVRDYWDAANFPRSSHGGQRSGMSDKEFMDLYNQTGGDISKMIDESGYHVSGLVKRCNSAGLPHKNNPRKRREKVSSPAESKIVRTQYMWDMENAGDLDVFPFPDSLDSGTRHNGKKMIRY